MRHLRRVADVVIWDSSPLALGATPTRVFIDGIAQLDNPYTVQKPEWVQNIPEVPDFDQEAKDAVKYDGLPPLEMKKATVDVVVFSNVHSIYLRRGAKIEKVFLTSNADTPGFVVVERGELKCYGAEHECSLAQYGTNIQRVDLKGGSIS